MTIREQIIEKTFELSEKHLIEIYNHIMNLKQSEITENEAILAYDEIMKEHRSAFEELAK